MAPRVEAQVAASDTPGSIRSECNHGPHIDWHKYREPLAGAITPIAMVANATSGSSLRRGADRVHYPTLCVQVARAMAVAALALVVGRFSAGPSEQHAGACLRGRVLVRTVPGVLLGSRRLSRSHAARPSPHVRGMAAFRLPRLRDAWRRLRRGQFRPLCG